VLAWLTIDSAGPVVCRALSIPSGFIPHLLGALGELSDPANWEQQGTLTPDECAEYMSEMWDTIRGCGVVGQVAAFATEVAPSGWLLCDGSEYTSDDYPELNAVIGDIFRVNGDIFTVPDIRGAAIFSEGNTMEFGATGGQRRVALSVAEMPPHDHEHHDWGSVVVNGFLGAAAALVPSESTQVTSSTGSGESHDNMPPNIVLRYYIRALP